MLGGFSRARRHGDTAVHPVPEETGGYGEFPVPFFMVSPSFIGLTVPAGTHQGSAEYRTSLLKSVLLAVGATVLLGTIYLGRRFARLDAFLAGSPGAGPGAPAGPAASS
jgi:hypothetical protein